MLQSDGKEACCGAGILKVLNEKKASERTVEEPDAVCGGKDSSCVPADKNSKKEMLLRATEPAFSQACHTVVLCGGNSNLSSTSSVSENNKLIQLPCITIWKGVSILKSFRYFAKQERNSTNEYLPWKLEAPVIYHLEPPSTSFLWLQDHLKSKGWTNLPSYLDQTLMVLLPKNKKILRL